MDILLESRAFYPSVGGLEMMAQELGKHWQKRGHEVRVMTVTPLGEQSELTKLDVLRFPTLSEWMRHLRWADVFFQNGVSLRSIAYPLVTKCPIVFRHPNILASDATVNIRNELKRLATNCGANVASCGPVAESIPGPTVTIPNTFRPVFEQPDAEKAHRDGLLFVGRLVSVKGADLAIEALRQLHERGVNTTLMICGGGPERKSLQEQVQQADLDEYVTFNGFTGPEELAEQYRSAELLLVPSRFEPFGIVALEAIASRCPVVAAQTGGLPEAVGDCGLLVPPDDAAALANAIEQALRPGVRQNLRTDMPAHVDRHRTGRIATDYLHVLRQAAQSRE
ncbi:glycosyltransferase involved in cell wall biosynthesis [Salinibacter ruber]|uniref:glycosyltransferase family 4 protein n=1 Tax=Salinibacter ruber TaxID=146919 RepID=UPI0021688E9D|nr:glycosyltransferase family 4 protein [Salinibacter ruber]MCS3827488.1 glycosyltransferase involved in cell wall biosynthesis [Salinibacter ruber]